MPLQQGRQMEGLDSKATIGPIGSILAAWIPSFTVGLSLLVFHCSISVGLLPCSRDHFAQGCPNYFMLFHLMLSHHFPPIIFSRGAFPFP